MSILTEKFNQKPKFWTLWFLLFLLSNASYFYILKISIVTLTTWCLITTLGIYLTLSKMSLRNSISLAILLYFFVGYLVFVFTDSIFKFHYSDKGWEILFGWAAYLILVVSNLIVIYCGKVYLEKSATYILVAILFSIFWCIGPILFLALLGVALSFFGIIPARP